MPPCTDEAADGATDVVDAVIAASGSLHRGSLHRGSALLGLACWARGLANSPEPAGHRRPDGATRRRTPPSSQVASSSRCSCGRPAALVASPAIARGERYSIAAGERLQCPRIGAVAVRRMVGPWGASRCTCGTGLIVVIGMADGTLQQRSVRDSWCGWRCSPPASSRCAGLRCTSPLRLLSDALSSHPPVCASSPARG